MGFFKKSSSSAPQQEIHICKYCGRMFTDDNFNKETNLCLSCDMICKSFEASLFQSMETNTKKAQEASDINEKIMYYKLILNYLYEYKNLYHDKGIQFLSSDVNALIDDILNKISFVRK
jgi:hypothetical protein